MRNTDEEIALAIANLNAKTPDREWVRNGDAIVHSFQRTQRGSKQRDTRPLPHKCGISFSYSTGYDGGMMIFSDPLVIREMSKGNFTFPTLTADEYQNAAKILREKTGVQWSVLQDGYPDRLGACIAYEFVPNANDRFTSSDAREQHKVITRTIGFEPIEIINVRGAESQNVSRFRVFYSDPLVVKELSEQYQNHLDQRAVSDREATQQSVVPVQAVRDELAPSAAGQLPRRYTKNDTLVMESFSSAELDSDHFVASGKTQGKTQRTQGAENGMFYDRKVLLPGTEKNFSIYSVKSRTRRGEVNRYLICDDATRKVVGYADFLTKSNNEIEMYIIRIASNSQGEGFGKALFTTAMGDILNKNESYAVKVNDSTYLYSGSSQQGIGKSLYSKSGKNYSASFDGQQYVYTKTSPALTESAATTPTQQSSIVTSVPPPQSHAAESVVPVASHSAEIKTVSQVISDAIMAKKMELPQYNGKPVTLLSDRKGQALHNASQTLTYTLPSDIMNATPRDSSEFKGYLNAYLEALMERAISEDRAKSMQDISNEHLPSLISCIRSEAVSQSAASSQQHPVAAQPLVQSPHHVTQSMFGRPAATAQTAMLGEIKSILTEIAKLTERYDRSTDTLHEQKAKVLRQAEVVLNYIQQANQSGERKMGTPDFERAFGGFLKEYDEVKNDPSNSRYNEGRNGGGETGRLVTRIDTLISSFHAKPSAGPTA